MKLIRTVCQWWQFSGAVMRKWFMWNKAPSNSLIHYIYIFWNVQIYVYCLLGKNVQSLPSKGSLHFRTYTHFVKMCVCVYSLFWVNLVEKKLFVLFLLLVPIEKERTKKKCHFTLTHATEIQWAKHFHMVSFRLMKILNANNCVKQKSTSIFWQTNVTCIRQRQRIAISTAIHYA